MVSAITDGTVWCNRCGEDRTSCALCTGMEPELSSRRFPSTREDDQEGINQERAIRRAAAKRQGF